MYHRHQRGSGLRTGTFDTTIWFASLRLEGEVLLDQIDRAVRIVLHLGVGWIQDEVASFTLLSQCDATVSGGLSLVPTREEA